MSLLVLTSFHFRQIVTHLCILCYFPYSILLMHLRVSNNLPSSSKCLSDFSFFCLVTKYQFSIVLANYVNLMYLVFLLSCFPIIYSHDFFWLSVFFAFFFLCIHCLNADSAFLLITMTKGVFASGNPFHAFLCVPLGITSHRFTQCSFCISLCILAPHNFTHLAWGTFEKLGISLSFHSSYSRVEKLHLASSVAYT